MTPLQIVKEHTRFTQCRNELGRLEERIIEAIRDSVWSGKEKEKNAILHWNLAIEACAERVYSNGSELNPELSAELRKLKR